MYQVKGGAGSEERRIYGFVEGVAPPIPSNNYSRFTLMLDAVDKDAFDDSPIASRNPDHLAIIRIISTPQRMLDLFGFVVPEEGSWVLLTVGKKAGFPAAWILSARNDFGENAVRTNVIGVDTLRRPQASPNSPRTVVDDLEDICTITPLLPPVTKIKNIKQTGERFHLRIVDVGHASCVAIHSERNSNSPIVGYFDAGAPAFFHSESFPTMFGEGGRVPNSGFVVLSHWDFDHYALAVTRLKQLQKLDWYAPRQKVGPNAAKFQVSLGARLQFISGNRVPITKGLKLYRGLGAETDRNSSGYVMHLSQNNEKVLLTADVGYDHIEPTLKNGLTGLSVPHHGGNGSSNPPNGRGVAAVSYGLPNRYRHPIEDNLRAHGTAGWTVRRTAAHRPFSRSDRWVTQP